MTNSKTVADRLKTVVCSTFSLKDSDYNEDLAAGDHPTWDSLGHVSLLSNVEQEFNITFDVEDAIEIESVEDLLDAVERYTTTTVS